MNYSNIYTRLCSSTFSGRTERHHIIPRCLGGSDDDRNICFLSPRAHALAHRLLAKMHPSHQGLAFAAFMMQHKDGVRISSRTYELLRGVHVKMLSETPRSQEHKDNIKKALTGKTLSEQTKKAIGNRNSGKKLSKQHTAAISNSLKQQYANGTRKPPMEGKKHSEETLGRLAGAVHKRIADGTFISPFSRRDVIEKSQETKRRKRAAGVVYASRPPATAEQVEVQRQKALQRVKTQRLTCPHCGKEGPKPNLMQHHFGRCRLRPNDLL